MVAAPGVYSQLTDHIHSACIAPHIAAPELCQNGQALFCRHLVVILEEGTGRRQRWGRGGVKERG